MGKKDDHVRDLEPLFDEFLCSGDDAPLDEYLRANSALPGRRGNLELAGAFGEVAGAICGPDSESVWALCLALTEITAEVAPVNSADEFLPFCGTIGLGAIAGRTPARCDEAFSLLKALANDPRWRMREAVAAALPSVLAGCGKIGQLRLESWIADGTALELRAVAAGLADPPLLANQAVGDWALAQHRKIVSRLAAIDNRRSEEFRVLRKALGYTISVVVAAIPADGFVWLEQLVALNDKDVNRIVKENLKKNRLLKPFPVEVKRISARLP